MGQVRQGTMFAKKRGLGDVFLQTAYKSPALLSVAARLATPSSSRRFIDSITGQMLGIRPSDWLIGGWRATVAQGRKPQMRRLVYAIALYACLF